MPQEQSREKSRRLAMLVNGEPRTVPEPATVAALLESLELSGRRVAIAVNREIVPRSHYAQAPVAAGDRIEILEAVGGG